MKNNERKKPDYVFKSHVIKQGLDKEQRKVSRTLFLGNKLINDCVDVVKDYDIDYEKLLKNQLDDLILKTGYSYFVAKMIERNECNSLDWQEAKKINHASYKRTTRLKERIQKMLLNGQCIFLTLTFSNDTLQQTTQETRRKYVSRYLKENCSQYIANIDYGSRNEREHYHAVVLCDKVNYSAWHHLGAIKGEKVRDTDDFTKLAKYVDKLTNHAIKETTKRNHLIYSRM